MSREARIHKICQSMPSEIVAECTLRLWEASLIASSGKQTGDMYGLELIMENMADPSMPRMNLNTDGTYTFFSPIDTLSGDRFRRIDSSFLRMDRPSGSPSPRNRFR